MLTPFTITARMSITESSSIADSDTSRNFTILRFMIFPPAIQKLFSIGCPTTISWRIIPIIVFAIKRMPWCWALSYIRKKCQEIMTPFLADCDASSTPSMPFRCIRNITTSIHVNPCFIFWREFGMSFGETVLVEHSYIISQKVA